MEPHAASALLRSCLLCLQGSLAVIGFGLLSGCRIPAPPGAPPPRVFRVGLFHVGLDHVPPSADGLRDGLKPLGYDVGSEPPGKPGRFTVKSANRGLRSVPEHKLIEPPSTQTATGMPMGISGMGKRRWAVTPARATEAAKQTRRMAKIAAQENYDHKFGQSIHGRE